jgi:hypothetical protein
MSRGTIVAIGAVVAVLVIAGVALYVLLSSAPAMTDGPGMLYFYSPT